MALLAQGYEVMVYDTLSNSNREVANGIAEIFWRRVEFILAGVREKKSPIMYWLKYSSDAVILFVGFKADEGSVGPPSVIRLGCQRDDFAV